MGYWVRLCWNVINDFPHDANDVCHVLTDWCALACRDVGSKVRWTNLNPQKLIQHMKSFNVVFPFDTLEDYMKRVSDSAFEYKWMNGRRNRILSKCAEPFGSWKSPHTDEIELRFIKGRTATVHPSFINFAWFLLAECCSVSVLITSLDMSNFKTQ